MDIKILKEEGYGEKQIILCKKGNNTQSQRYILVETIEPPGQLFYDHHDINNIPGKCFIKTDDRPFLCLNYSDAVNIWQEAGNKGDRMTTTFNTKREAESFAIKRRKAFRGQIKKAEKDNWYNSSPKRLRTRQKFLKESIKTVKVVRTKLKHWTKPLYEVVGR